MEEIAAAGENGKMFGDEQDSKMSTEPEKIVALLTQYSSCDIADALLRLGVRHGGYLADLNLYAGEKLCGPAYTVQFVRKEDIRNKLDFHYIDRVPPSSVLFLSCPPGIVNAVFGGLMSTRAKYLGAAGAVVDGRIRDLAEHRDVGLTVFAKGTGTTAGQEVVLPGSVNEAVVFYNHPGQPGNSIYPGDYLFGDLNGVVVIPKRHIDRVCSLLPEIVAADQKVATAIREGMSVQEAFGLFRK